MIPPGLHFLYYSPVSKEGQVAPRTGFFRLFSKGEVVAWRYDPASEELKEVSEEERSNLKMGLKEIDGRLGPYPHSLWQKWVSLSSRVTGESLARLLQTGPGAGGEVCAITQVMSEESGELGPGARIHFTPLAKERFPPGCTAQEITEHNMDSSHRLQKFLEPHSHIEEVLVELQFAFLCFLVAQNYDSFEHWKQLVALMCGCSKALLKYPQLFLNFMSDLHFQMQEVPQDFFIDIISENNFLVKSLTDLFANMRETEGVTGQLRARAISFENHLSKKFGWDFSEEDEEFAPVVVET